jgi:hypothetical protein
MLTQIEPWVFWMGYILDGMRLLLRIVGAEVERAEVDRIVSAIIHGAEGNAQEVALWRVTLAESIELDYPVRELDVIQENEPLIFHRELLFRGLNLQGRLPLNVIVPLEVDASKDPGSLPLGDAFKSGVMVFCIMNDLPFAVISRPKIL